MKLLVVSSHAASHRSDGRGVWAVSRHADVTELLKTPDVFGSEGGIALTDLANQQILAGTVLASDDTRHKKLRRVLSKQLAPRAMKALADRITGRAERLVATYTAPGRFDAVALSRDMVCDTVMELMGLPNADREVLLNGAAATFDVFGPDNSRYQRALPLASRMVEMLHEKLIRENVERGTWMGAIFEAVDAGQIDEADAIPLAPAYTAAAIDTTVLGLADCLVQLARHPKQWQILRRDPIRWATPAFHEALRLEAPIQGFGRLLTKDAAIGGVHLAAGEQVWLLYGSGGRDPRHWGDESDVFDVQRPRNDQHLAFGGGPHLCAGIPLAELQDRAVLRALAARCSHLTLGGEPVRVLNNLLRGYSSAPIAAELSPGPPRPAPGCRRHFRKDPCHDSHDSLASQRPWPADRPPCSAAAAAGRTRLGGPAHARASRPPRQAHLREVDGIGLGPGLDVRARRPVRDLPARGVQRPHMATRNHLSPGGRERHAPASQLAAH